MRVRKWKGSDGEVFGVFGHEEEVRRMVLRQEKYEKHMIANLLCCRAR